jgi:hypothetical protein
MVDFSVLTTSRSLKISAIRLPAGATGTPDRIP